jgi:cytochrome c5
MKYQKLILAAGILALIQCKSKSKLAGTESPVKEDSPSARELAVAEKRWAGTTLEELKQGKIIFDNKCTTCHAAKKIVGRTEESWKDAIEKMAPKAKLSPEEKEKLTKYILSFREANS